ncbi:MAG: hypothetical protein ACK5HR_04590, partial [Mycoplasmatales bacterium]
LLFGMIAQNGIRILANSHIDIAHPRNLIIGSVILVLGLGSASISFNLFGIDFSFSQMSLAALAGILFHLILPYKEVSSPKNDPLVASEQTVDVDSVVDL